VTFTVEAFPGKTFVGKISFLNPEVDLKTRTIPIRVNVPNEEGRLKPGMFVRATVASRIGENGRVFAPDMSGKWISPMHPEIVKDHSGQCDVCGMDLVPAETLGYVKENGTDAPITVPSSAVLRTGKRAVVYVEKPDADRPTYEGREIVLGPRADDVYLVESGLRAGERVVTHGAFKIDSALQIQAKPSMMNPEGGGSAPGHDHGGTPGTGDAHARHEEMSMALAIPSGQAAKLLEPYLAMHTALASDDLEAAKRQARAMMEVTGHNGDLPALLHNMLGAETLDAFRKPHFDIISTSLIKAVNADPDDFTSGLIVMNCPMVYDDRGADWLQADEALRNPYFGASMLHCGSRIEVIGTTKKKSRKGIR
jgi:Cu(I)/Ag(I) efflux system membrane fusion protein